MDLVIEDAVVVTMDDTRSTGSSFLIRDGRLAAVGHGDEIGRLVQPGALVVRLDGATVVPGLIDAHCHPSLVGYVMTGADCSSPVAADIPTIQARLRETAESTPDESWVMGSGYVEYKLREGRHPTRWELDKAVPNRPCVLYHTSLHACVLNSLALAAAGLRDDAPDPADGILGRDQAGNLSGLLFEAPALAVLREGLKRDVSRMGEQARAEMIARACRHFASLGITSCVDALVRPETYQAFVDAARLGLLCLRVSGMLDHEEVDLLARLEEPPSADWLQMRAVKMFADGGMSSRTAAIDGEYPVPPYGSGILFHDRDELVALMREYDRRGLQIGVHAQGDRAIRTVLEAYAEILRGTRGNPMRHRVEHAGAIYPALTAQAAALQINVVTQPGFLSLLGDGFANAFGDERANLLYPLSSLRRADVVVAGSSDAPVISASPLLGMQDAVLRRTLGGRTLGQDERLTREEALELYTRAGAYVSHRDDVGSLEPGKWADFTVLDANPLEVSADVIGRIGVIATAVGGEVTHQREPIFPDQDR